MANKYNFSLTVNGLEATANGCNVESISITSDGEFGNELVSVFGQIFEGILTKIPTPTTIADPEVKRVVERVSAPNKVEDSFQVSWDLEGVWKALEATMPMADFNVEHKKPGFKKKAIGKYEFLNPIDTDENHITFELRDDSIVLAINTNLFVLREDPKFSSVVGIHTSLIPELIESIPDEDVRKVVKTFIEKVLKK